MKRLRQRLSLTQFDIVERIGASLTSVSRWENDHTAPNPYYLRRLCDVLECKPEQIYPNLGVEVPKETSPTQLPPTLENEPIPNRIREARQRKGMTQEELAEAIEATRVSVSRWEKGSVVPNRYNIRKLCSVLGVRRGYLFPSPETTSNIPAPASSTKLEKDQQIKSDKPVETLSQQFTQLTTSSLQTTSSVLEEIQMLRREMVKLEVMREQLNVRIESMEYLIETTKKVVEILYPSADEETRTNLIKTMLSDLPRQVAIQEDSVQGSVNIRDFLGSRVKNERRIKMENARMQQATLF